MAAIGAWFGLVATAASIGSFSAFCRKVEKWLESFFGCVLIFSALRIFKSAIAR